MTQRLSHPKALVLVVVVYIVAALSMLAFALAFRSRMAIKGSIILIERARQDQIAHAARVQACGELTDDDGDTDSLDESWADWHKLIPSETNYEATDEDENVWEASWRVIDESSKINVNLAYPDLLLQLEFLDEAAVASILDWIDQDNVPGPDGAENDYYSSLDAGYNCKNAPFETIDELLLVKGITAEIYYGSNLNKLLTIYGDGRININTASKTVLDVIPLLSDAAVNEIISGQEDATETFSSMADIENNDNFMAADILSLAQVAKFSSNHFQLQIKVKNKRRQLGCQYLAIIERKAGAARLLSWQRKSPTVLKDMTAFAAGNSENVYLQD